MNRLHRFFSSFLLFTAKLAGRLPIGILYFKAGFLRIIAEKILHYRYQVIIQNLSRSFPEKNYKDIRALAHGFYIHFFEIFAEVIKSQGLKPADAKARFHIENPELINDLHSRGINVIAMAGHRGNWEWVIMMPLFFGFNIYTLYKPLSSGIMENLMGRIRARFGMKLLSMQQAGRFILSKKDYPALYIFVGDQSPSHKDPDFSFDFLNQPSLLFTGGAKLARATSSAVVYLSIDKKGRGYYSASFRTIAEPSENKTDREILSIYARMLEEDIRRQPAYWLWSHKRWKNRAENS
ncbi:MAG: lysophospholipid acyltransferase family protein [Bacteroidales bacterium]|nr:lysophospholipid acyltransferase family protein [Bacteroidales bacterium]